MRLDIGWNDLCAAIAYSVLPINRLTAIQQAEQSWSQENDFLVTLSVRSAFDLTLRALQLPHGSEIILTALTVPDMVRIVISHGLIPVPVDVDDQGHIYAESLKRAVSIQTRMIVVAHLFGGQAPLDDVLEVAQEHKLIVVEDCAQSFHKVGDSGHPASDIAMFSFGPIKTATALGGAVVCVSSPEMRERMAFMLKNDPIQSRISFAHRIIWFTALKALSGRRVSFLFKYCCQWLGFNFDSIANSSARGFTGLDFLSQIRRQPCTPLLRLLRRRWIKYDFERIMRRIQMGRHLDERIGLRHAASHSYWVYPLFIQNAKELCDRFRAAGFDATCLSRMAVVPATDKSGFPTSAHSIWKNVLFLPWYPELTDEAIEEVATLISASDLRMEQELDRRNQGMHAEPPHVHSGNII